MMADLVLPGLGPEVILRPLMGMAHRTIENGTGGLNEPSQLKSWCFLGIRRHRFPG
jgi:hypothetical protein